jgi:hypothetical protein
MWRPQVLQMYRFSIPDMTLCFTMQVYEDIGSSRQALVVHGSVHGRTFRLTEIRVLHVSGNDPGLELNRSSLVRILFLFPPNPILLPFAGDLCLVYAAISSCKAYLDARLSFSYVLPASWHASCVCVLPHFLTGSLLLAG